MFGRETQMLLRHYLEQGRSKSALAREVGVSRDTIHRWIHAGDLDRDLEAEPVRYGPRGRCRPSSMRSNRSLKRD
jgi:transposase-like protein